MSRKFNNDVGQKQMRSAHCKATETDMMVSQDIRSNTVAESETLGQTETEQMQNTERGETSFMAEERNEGSEGRRLNDTEAENLISKMKESAETAPVLELTPKNWEREFGKENTVTTPLGTVKMGNNQYAKLVEKKRADYFGMIKPTLERPDAILEEYDPQEGAERDTKYLFVKTFVKPDGSRVVHFESVTVRKEGMEVSVSNHELDQNQLKTKMQNDKVLHLNEKLSPDSEMRLTETPNEERPDLVPTSDNLSEGKGSENSVTSKESAENSQFSAEERRVAVTDKLMHDLRAFWQQ